MKVFPTLDHQLVKQYPDAPFYPPTFWSDEESYSTTWCGTEGCRGGSPYGPDFNQDDNGDYYWSAGSSCACGASDRDFVFYDGMEEWEGM